MNRSRGSAPAANTAEEEGLTPSRRARHLHRHGLAPSFVGRTPTFVACNPTILECNPTFLACNPTFLACNPTFLGCDPTFVDRRPNFVGSLHSPTATLNTVEAPKNRQNKRWTRLYVRSSGKTARNPTPFESTQGMEKPASLHSSDRPLVRSARITIPVRSGPMALQSRSPATPRPRRNG